MIKIKNTRKKLLILTIEVFLMLVLTLLGPLIIAHASSNLVTITQQRFLEYDGSDNKFLITAKLKGEELRTLEDLRSWKFSIEIETFDGTWISPCDIMFDNVKIELLGPNGETLKTYSFEDREYKEGNDESVFQVANVFAWTDFVQNGAVKNGTYVVRSSGRIYRSNTGAEQYQSGHIKFNINIVEPSIKVNNEVLEVNDRIFNANTLTIEFSTGATTEPSGGKELRRFNADGTLTAPTFIGNMYTFNVTSDAKYQLTYIDSIGRQVTRTFIVDITAPEILYNNKVVNSNATLWTNSEFTIGSKDFLSVKAHAEKPRTESVHSQEGNVFRIKLQTQNFGEWEFSYTDSAGNESIITVILYKHDCLDNFTNFSNSYKVGAWYDVTLPSRVFGSVEHHSFRTYDLALDYAMQREWAERVKIKSANEFEYVSVGNENTQAIYYSKEDVEQVVKHYASKYVNTERSVMSELGELPKGATERLESGEWLSTSESLNEGANRLDGHDLAVTYAKNTSIFSLAQAEQYLNKSLYLEFVSKSKVTLLSLSNGRSYTIGYGAELSTLDLMEGYYKVTENDVCGNTAQYIILLDRGAPGVEASVTQGNGNSQTLMLDEDYIALNDNGGYALKCVSIKLNAITDACDDIAFMRLSGRGYDDVTFLLSEKLPTLSYEHDCYGAYDLTLYDRSQNVLKFKIIIADAPPSVAHTSLTNNTKCTFTLSVGKNDSLQSLAIYKISWNGERIELKTDDDGNEIFAGTTQYVFRFGGKFLFVMTDTFERTIELGPFFYQKGLPSGTLKGVKVNSVTGNDVALTYSNEYCVELYEKTQEKNEWTKLWSEADQSQDSLVTFNFEKNNKKVIIYSDKIDGERKFKFFLYVPNERNLFIEYEFTMKVVTPSVEIKTESGRTVLIGEIINEPFYLTWENGTYDVEYKKATSITTLSYTRQQIIDTGGEWEFVITDDVGNTFEFSITLDEVIDYIILGKTQEKNGELLSKEQLIIKVNECTQRRTVECVNASVDIEFYDNTDGTSELTLRENGKYIIFVQDLAGNEKQLIIVIDNVAPTIRVLSADDGTELLNGAITNKFFTIVTDNASDVIEYEHRGETHRYTLGTVLNEDGKYTITAYDEFGNRSSEFAITLKSNLAFEVNGKYIIDSNNGIYKSRSWISITALGEIKRYIIASQDGNKSYALGERINEENTYDVEIEDFAGNIEKITLIIDKTAPNVEIKTVSGKVLEPNGYINESFFLVFLEEDVKKATYYSVATERTHNYDGGAITEIGKYEFSVSDDVGNETTFSVEIDKEVNYVVVGHKVYDSAKREYIGKTAIAISVKDTLRRFEAKNENGKTYSYGEKITAEGKYSVEIEDFAGNIEKITLIIDKTAPIIVLNGVSNNGKTAQDVTFYAQDDRSSTVQVRIEHEKKHFGNSEIVLSTHGEYEITATDDAGNESKVSFDIDKRVDYELSNSGNKYTTTAVTLIWNEKVNVIATKDGNTISFSKGTLKEAGNYLITAMDELDNVVVLTFSILPSKAKHYTIETDNAKVDVRLSDGTKIMQVSEKSTFTLDTHGDYVLTFTSEIGQAYMLELSVYTTPPSVRLKQIKRGYEIVGDENYTYTLEINGSKSIECSVGEKITANGKYTLTATDEYGNTTVLRFEVFRLNVASYVLIVLGSVTVLTIIVIVLLLRKKSSIR